MIFDGHSDLWIDIVNLQEKYDGTVLKDYYLEKLKKNGIMGSIFVFWVDPPYSSDNIERMNQIMDIAKKELDNAKNGIKRILKPNDIIDKSDRFKLMLGMEGLGHIGDDLSLISKYYDFGVRHASLTWNDQNRLATGASQDPSRGLQPIGKQAVKEIEKLKMILDVSHLNEKSFWDLMGTATRPVIASHSNASSICNHKRNLSDNQIKTLAKNGGLIGMNSFGEFVSEDKNKRNLDGLMKHVTHIANMVGVEHITAGFDFCDYIDESSLANFSSSVEQPGINGLNTMSDAINFKLALNKAGFNNNEIDMILYKNYQNLLKKLL